jgi:hypothetical protein
MITYNSNFCSPAKEGMNGNSLLADPVFQVSTHSVLNTNTMNSNLRPGGISRNNSQVAASVNISTA